MSFRWIAIFALAAGLPAQTVLEFSEAGRKHRYQLADERVAQAEGARPAPVFYDLESLPPAERLAALSPAERENRLAGARRFGTEKLLIRMDAGQRKGIERAGALRIEPSLLDGWMLARFADAFTALRAARQLQSEGWELTPVLARKWQPRQTGTLQRPVNDANYSRQWHFLDEKVNLNMQASWDVATGKGINITVVDDGLEINHEDLVASAYAMETGFHRNFNDGPENDPSPTKLKQNHGTNCAGLVGARGFNEIGVVGVAPEARLMGLRLIAGEAGDDAEGTALAWQPEGILTHVSSNSWGPTDDGANAGRIGPLHMAGIEKAATQNRDGKGTVIVVSAGNGRGNRDDASYDEFSGSRFAIQVAAVNRKGEQSSYSEGGMGVAISAIGGEFNPPEVLWTTNNSGDEELAALKEAFETSQALVNYSDAFNGTSAAAPQVSGAAALLLERNPDLGYRDVKEILIRTARREPLTGGDEFKENGAGLRFSHSFGAGLLNVSGALNLANGWTNLGPLTSISETASGSAPIPEDNSGATATFEIGEASKLRVEHVEFTVTLKHPVRGELGFAIISPSGMISVAEARPKDDAADFTEYKFTSVRHWGENSEGTWRVRVIDAKANDSGGTLEKVDLRLWGVAR
jgi:subtilisin family serine protease